MIELDKYDIFRKNKRPLKELLKDNSVPANIQYMITSEVQTINFDRIKSIYEDNLGLKGEQEFILYALERYNKLYFKDIHTYTEEEFEEYARNLL